MEINSINSLQGLNPQSLTGIKDEKEKVNSSPFADIYNELITNVEETQAQKNEDAYNLAMGNADDLHSVMINAQKASIAMQLTVNVTNKALSAYNEIIKMNI